MFAFFGILTLTSTMAAAEPNITPYQLQESCEKLAPAIFHRETADDEDRFDYWAHYNARLNKCFYAETYVSHTSVGNNVWVYLSDLQANRIYGGFLRSVSIGLFIATLKTRNATHEWNELVKPYMED